MKGRPLRRTADIQMPAIILNGKETAAAIKAEVAAKTAQNTRTDRAPCLAVILVGEDPASQVYVRNKKNACAACGFRSAEYLLSADTSEADLLALIADLNADDTVDGILCQLPLPGQIREQAVIDAISPEKDVDGFHPVNAGRLLTGQDCFMPCTPAGVVELLRRAGVPMAGKHCVIVGRSNIVGKPAALLMLRENATVTVCHSRTENLKETVRTGDIVIAAVGRANFITADMIKPGAAVVDVGINRLPEGGLCGDVDFAAASEVAGWISPVPGGVGPMTIAMLMKNTLLAYENRRLLK